MLRQLADDLWDAEYDLFLPGRIHFPCRMTVVRLPDGGLWLHSPVPIDDALAAALDALGPVAHLVAPSQLHHLFFADAAARYPGATTWGAPGLAAKIDLPFAKTLGEDPAPWNGVLDAHFVDGIPWMSETVFLHQPSGSLVVTDLFFHMMQPKTGVSRFFFWMLGVLGRPKQSPLVRMQTKDKVAAARSAQAIIAWGPSRLVPAHGPVIQEGAADALAQVLAPMIKAGGGV